MHILSSIIFALLLAGAGYLIGKRIQLIRQTILLGRDENRHDQPERRRAMMIQLAFGQQRMFDRPLVGILHLVVYLGFILINIEVLEIILDGLLGTHRLFAPLLGSAYPALINFFESLAVGVLVVCVVFLIRRNITHVPRLQAQQHRELKGFPVIDANVILWSEIILMKCLLVMNATDAILQARHVEGYHAVGTFWWSGTMVHFFENWQTPWLVLLERTTWWLHIVGILAFAVYVTYSKHLHIFLAFPATYFASLKPSGTMANMPAVTQEVQIMLGLAEAPSTTTEIERFGAKDIQDLTWKNLLDAYACTECGRCTSQCPANLTGKALSPRKIMMDTRDRLEEVGKAIQANQGQRPDDGKALYGDYISSEELRACTTCQACVDACPINLSPLDIILQLRRYQIMEEANAPASWNMMFGNLENNQAPWKFSPSDRFNWNQM